MGIDPARLGPDAQKQIAEKLAQNSRSQVTGVAANSRKGENKYRNTPAERKTDSGAILRFASKKEAARYDELMLMLKAGEIRNLRLQPEYTLQEAYTTTEGERVQAIRYRADFSYSRIELLPDEDLFGVLKPVVEDAKGHRTDVYKMKKKMMLERYGIEIQEV